MLPDLNTDFSRDRSGGLVFPSLEINESERKKEKRIKRNEENLRDLQDNVKHPNIRIIGVPEEEDKKKAMRNYLRR